MRPEALLEAIKDNLLCLYYHLNNRHIDDNTVNFLKIHYHVHCRDIRDNGGAIKQDEMQRCQNTFYPCFRRKAHQLNANRRDLKCS